MGSALRFLLVHSLVHSLERVHDRWIERVHCALVLHKDCTEMLVHSPLSQTVGNSHIHYFHCLICITVERFEFHLLEIRMFTAFTVEFVCVIVKRIFTC